MSIRRPADDDFERLLAGAEWPELESPEAAEAANRLSRAWHELRRVEPARTPRAPRRMWVSVGAIAAAVAVAVVGVRWRSLPDREAATTTTTTHQADVRPDPSVAEPAPPKPIAPPRHLPERQPADEPAVEPTKQLVREPNAYERLVLASRARAREAQVPAMIAEYQAEREITTSAETRGASPEERALDRLLASGSPLAAARFLTLVVEPSEREAALAALGRAEHPPIDDIAAFLDDPRRPVRLAAAHALSTLDDARAVELLSQSVGGIGRQEALMALLASRSRRAGELIDAARQNVYLVASVRAAEQQLLTLQTENGENLP